MKDTVEVFFHSQQPYTQLNEEDFAQYKSGRLDFPNTYFDPEKAHHLYNQYHEQYSMADEAGLDGIMTNEHHSSYWNMKPSANIDAAVISRLTNRVRIAILGNIIPINEPVRMAEELAMLDCFSNGRLISGFVRGGAVETLQAGIDPTENRDRFEEAHYLIIKCWTEPGPFRFEGRLLPPPGGQSVGAAGAEAAPAGVVPRRQQPGERGVGGATRVRIHEPGGADQPDQATHSRSISTRPRRWGSRRGRSTSSTRCGRWWPTLTRRHRSFGRGFLWAGRHRMRGPIEHVDPPGYQSPTASRLAAQRIGGATAPPVSYEDLQEVGAIVVGSPDTVAKKLSGMIEELNPGYMIQIGSDGNIPHKDVMRSVELLGKEVVPALHEIQLAPYK